MAALCRNARRTNARTGAHARVQARTAPVHTRGCSQNQFFLDALNPYERSFQSAARRFATQLRIGTR